MALKPKTGTYETRIDDVTGSLHLVHHEQDGTITDIVTYSQADVVAAIEALPLDSVTGALLTIDAPHGEIHEGDSFVAYYHDADADDADTVNLRLVTPNTAARIHLFFDITGTLATTWEIFESCTHNAGTAVVAYNKDRNSANTATLVVTHTASGGADGTVIDCGTFGDGKKSGGQERGGEEFILKQNTVYLLKATSHAANNRISIRARWYEEG